MLKLVSTLPLLAAAIAVLAFVGTVTLMFRDHMWWALLTSFVTTIFGAIAYTGLRIQRKVDSVTDVTDAAIDTVGKHVSRVADAVVDRVNKK